MKKPIILIACLLLVYKTISQGILFEIPNLELVMKKAAKEQKLVFLYANVFDCVPCADIEEYAFQDSIVSDFFNENFINVNVDMESFPGVELADRYKIYVYPGLLFLNSQGEVVHRSCGAMDDQQVMSEASKALDEKENLKAYRTRFYKGEKGYDFLKQYGTMLDNACLESRDFIEYYFRNVEEENWIDSTSWMMIKDFVFDPFSNQFKFLRNNYAQFAALYGRKAIDQKIYNMLLAQFVDIYEGQDLTVFAIQSLNEILSSLSFEGKDELSVMSKLLYAEQVEDWDMYAQNVIYLENKGFVTDSYQLNEFAWKFYLFIDNKDQLEQALSWMKKLSKSNPTATNLDTYASLLFKTGNAKMAKKKGEEALDLARTSQEDVMHYQIQLEKFKSED